MIHQEISEEKPLNNYITLKTISEEESVGGIYIPGEDRFKTGIGTVLGISPDLQARYGANLKVREGDRVRHMLRVGIVCDKNTMNQTVIIEYGYLLTVFTESGEEIPLNEYVTLTEEKDPEQLNGIYISDADQKETGIGTVIHVSELISAGLSKHYRNTLKAGELVKYKKERATILPNFNGQSVTLISYGDLMSRVYTLKAVR